MGSIGDLWMLLTILFIALLAPGLAESPDGEAWILRCRVDSAEQTVRTFRVAPQLLQEWRPADRRFGPNLCQTFSCKADRDKLEGVISSASLILTLRIDRATSQGSWSTVGASGLRQTHGPCSAKREKPGEKLG
jgi:hypothetical protein